MIYDILPTWTLFIIIPTAFLVFIIMVQVIVGFMFGLFEDRETTKKKIKFEKSKVTNNSKQITETKDHQDWGDIPIKNKKEWWQ